MPTHQDEKAKHGAYDVLKQLPNTSENYPLCESCNGHAWRIEGKRFGMEKQVQEVYGAIFR